jgi:hypothetical protein
MIVRSTIASLLLMQVSFAGAEDPQSSSSTLIAPFEFHSAFWINLHHFLYQQALQKVNRSRGPASVEHQTWAGAYIFGRNHIHTIVSSFDPSNQGFAAVEVLFHEAAHGMVEENEGRLADQIAASCQLNHLAIPDGLWHAVIFFTAEEFVRRDLVSVGVQSYQPYAEKNGLYARVGWNRYESALQLFWTPHLNGTLSLQTAISKTISALAVAENHDH